jgi:SpoVK/Ycf46/Vps4 family AAA+-type ATPase
MAFEFEKQQEFNWIQPHDIVETIYDCKGDEYQQTFQMVKKIISNQFSQKISKGIKGFILHGPAGTGKTTLAKIISKSLSIPLLFVDGSDIAHHYYGESEQRVKKIFKEAESKKAIILIDDAESVFPDREWAKGQSWHNSQNNMLLHTLGNIDTSKTIVIMTTNKYNLLDSALKDRLYNIEFKNPNIDILIEIAEKKCEELKLKSDDIVKEIKSKKSEFVSIRDIEKFIMKKYVEGLK